jgi:hypothetical protein
MDILKCPKMTFPKKSWKSKNLIFFKLFLIYMFSLSIVTFVYNKKFWVGDFGAFCITFYYQSVTYR